MRSYRKGSHTVYDLKVHLVWITKYRYNVLPTEVGLRIRELIRQVCDANGIEILQGRVSKAHIHLYVSYPPSLSVSEMVRRLKGRSSRRIQEEFPQLGKRYWGQHFGGIGYAAFSSGHVTDEMIQE
jgi:putative transposase